MRMRRKPLIIIASVIVFLGIVAGAYFLLRGSGDLAVSDNPFSGIGSGLIDGEGPADMESGAGEELAPNLIRVTDRPVAEGLVAINRISTTSSPIETASGTPAVYEAVVNDTEVRFIDRASGNIYRYMAHERSLTRLSNKTLPGVQEASWLPDGSVAYARFVGEGDTVSSYVLPDSGEGGFFLEQNLSTARATPAGSLLTVLSGTTGSVGALSRSDGTEKRDLFTSALSAIKVYASNGGFFAQTKPSVFLNGYAFQISAASGAFTRVLGPLRGLSVLPSPDGKFLLYTYVDRGTLRLSLLDMTTRAQIPLPLATLTEKCTWTTDSLSVYCAVPTGLSAGLPDFWYQGAAVLSDRFWKISVTDRLATLIVDPSTIAGVSIDGVSLQTDAQEDMLFFTDKHNGALWAYDM